MDRDFQPCPNIDELPLILTVDELAVLLRVKRDTVYRAIQRGEIPGARRVGRTIRICRHAVVQWLYGEDRDWQPTRSKR